MGGSGDFPVVRVDDHPSPTGSLIIKVDTEGTEREVICGAREHLTAAVAAVVGFEAHQSAIARTGVDPRDVIHALPESDRWSATIAEYPDVRLDSRVHSGHIACPDCEYRVRRH